MWKIENVNKCTFSTMYLINFHKLTFSTTCWISCKHDLRFLMDSTSNPFFSMLEIWFVWLTRKFIWLFLSNHSFSQPSLIKVFETWFFNPNHASSISLQFRITARYSKLNPFSKYKLTNSFVIVSFVKDCKWSRKKFDNLEWTITFDMKKRRKFSSQFWGTIEN